eukprot:TRINITY_DN374_c0_g2_i3.p2 TRINITY_DN374_c0_g2~~TRINITY_DN374_c0_g2_i3.p2  ORF type:complete len:372 (+),score=134.86 TRINITY_DN374_c0_g2_i3:106-1116(+)
MIDTCGAETTTDLDLYVFRDCATNGDATCVAISGDSDCSNAYGVETAFVGLAGYQYFVLVSSYSHYSTQPYALSITATPYTAPEAYLSAFVIDGYYNNLVRFWYANWTDWTVMCGLPTGVTVAVMEMADFTPDVLYVMSDAGDELWRWFPGNCSMNKIGDTTATGTPVGMAWSPKSHEMYSMFQSGADSVLYYVDITTGTHTLLWTFSGYQLGEIAFDNDNVLWAEDLSNDVLVQLSVKKGLIYDLETCTGLNFDDVPQGLAYDFNTDQLIVAENRITYSYYYTYYGAFDRELYVFPAGGIYWTPYHAVYALTMSGVGSLAVGFTTLLVALLVALF